MQNQPLAVADGIFLIFMITFFCTYYLFTRLYRKCFALSDDNLNRCERIISKHKRNGEIKRCEILLERNGEVLDEHPEYTGYLNAELSSLFAKRIELLEAIQDIWKEAVQTQEQLSRTPEAEAFYLAKGMNLLKGIHATRVYRAKLELNHAKLEKAENALDNLLADYQKTLYSINGLLIVGILNASCAIDA
jgi:hypothetical protein